MGRMISGKHARQLNKQLHNAITALTLERLKVDEARRDTAQAGERIRALEAETDQLALLAQSTISGLDTAARALRAGGAADRVAAVLSGLVRDGQAQLNLWSRPVTSAVTDGAQA